jgi:hypothetical protein
MGVIVAARRRSVAPDARPAVNRIAPGSVYRT